MCYLRKQINTVLFIRKQINTDYISQVFRGMIVNNLVATAVLSAIIHSNLNVYSLR